MYWDNDGIVDDHRGDGLVIDHWYLVFIVNSIVGNTLNLWIFFSLLWAKTNCEQFGISFDLRSPIESNRLKVRSVTFLLRVGLILSRARYWPARETPNVQNEINDND